MRLADNLVPPTFMPVRTNRKRRNRPGHSALRHTRAPAAFRTATPWVLAQRKGCCETPATADQIRLLICDCGRTGWGFPLKYDILSCLMQNVDHEQRWQTIAAEHEMLNNSG
jgi:hypothetical protein